jgi:hypothetical protein
MPLDFWGKIIIKNGIIIFLEGVSDKEYLFH